MTTAEMSGVNTCLHLATARSRAMLTAVFGATILLSAFLLFSVQPMFTKLVLPVLGGSPGVWSVAMVFFQALLLGGYLWAHLLTRYVPFRAAACLHLGMTLAAMLALPLSLGASPATPPEHGQAFWLIGVFAAAVGLPFFALSANGPLLQAWFARGGHPDAYRLYGASNIGSFGALLAYPFAVEPFMGLAQQSRLWSIGYGVLFALLAACALFAMRSERGADETGNTTARGGAWTWGRFASWTLLAAVPSGLLVSVTAHISTDIASAPLLWVLPLALYLLTFVLAFRNAFPLRDEWLAPLQGLLALAILTFLTMGGAPFTSALALHFLYFFASVLIGHRSLYLLRPGHADLTAFYCAMSLGGVAGGLFAGMLAPQIFNGVHEYPILIAMGFLCLPGVMAELRNTGWREIAGPALAIALCWFAAERLLDAPRAIALAGAAIFSIGLLRWRSWRQLAICVLALCLVVVWLPPSLMKTQSWRSFFGVHKVREIEHQGGEFRVLMHGATMHGAVRIGRNGQPTPSGNPLPTTYYSSEGPLAEALNSDRQRRGGLTRIHAIGLGVGALACQRRAGEEIVFFEIDPEVIRLARQPGLFDFIPACAPDARIVLGDARLTLARETGMSNVMIVDAFSSDSIPVHLLTREALDVYFSRLAPDGVLVFHISNNVMDLTQTVARLAAASGLAAYRRVHNVAQSPDVEMRTSSIAMALAREPAHLGAIAGAPHWKRIEANGDAAPWTDDFSTILDPIAAHWRHGGPSP